MIFIGKPRDFNRRQCFNLTLASLTDDEEPSQSPDLVDRRLSPKKIVKSAKGKRKDDDPYEPVDTKKRKYTPQRKQIKKVAENEIAVIKVPKTKSSSDRKAEKESVEEKARPLVLASCKLCNPNSDEYAGSVRSGFQFCLVRFWSNFEKTWIRSRFGKLKFWSNLEKP